jgi:hypothetical protein
MEAVTAITRNYLQNVRVVLILGVILGFILGIIFAWGIWPVEVVDTTPEVMRQDLQQDYLRMTIDSYNRTGDPNRAIRTHQALVDEDRFTRDVFGPAFARAYYTITRGYQER